MRTSTIALLSATAAAVGADAYSFRGKEAFADLRRMPMVATRSTTLLGDLINTTSSTLSSAGSEISGVLTGAVSAIADNTSYTAPNSDKGSPDCKKDTCCIWSYVVSDMRSAFASSGACTPLARQAIRLGFHDAAAWNTSVKEGGADGSVVLSSEENSRPENLGLQNITTQMQTWFSTYKQYNVTMADLIQMGATTAIVTCPGGPRIKSFVGRVDRDKAAPPDLIPSPFSDATTNIALFQAKTFSAGDLVALVGAHTVSQQFFVDPSKAGESQDTTDGQWDNKFYQETLSPQAPNGVFRFPSDLSLSNSSQTMGTWQNFAKDQGAWAKAFAPAYFRMSMLGVDNMKELTNCTNVLPTSSA